MKKFFTAAVATTAVSMMAFASSLNVPFFVDWEQIGASGFIGLKNNTNEAIVVSVFYRDGNGDARTPGPPATGGNFGDEFPNAAPGTYNSDPGNTFLLDANQAVGFRPASNSDPKGPVPGEDEDLPAIPKMMGSNIWVNGTVQEGAGEFPPFNGSAEIRWMTVNSASDIQGRYLQFGGGSSSAYLLPPGIAVD